MKDEFDDAPEMDVNETDEYWEDDKVEGPELKLADQSKQYVIDFEKVKTLDEVILILQAMNLHIIANPDGGGQFEEIFYMLKEA